MRERRGERGEIRGCAIKLADILRKRVVAWWGQYGEKLDGTNSGRVSMDAGRVSARDKQISSTGILAPQKQIPWREFPSLMDHRFPEDSQTTQ